MSSKAEEEVFLGSARVRRRYGNISDMTLWRWVHKEEVGFPKPMIVNGRQLWKIAEIEAWERRAAAGEAAAIDPERGRRAAAKARDGKKAQAAEA
jgi:predicted DNA-binding transcriptional regulator AlpA